MKREKGMMDFATFKKIIDESKGKLEFTYLHLFGESLLHRDLFKMIEYCKDAGIFTGLATNATILDEIKSQKIIDSGLDFLVISFDGTSKETYEMIRRGGSFEQTLENIRTFLGFRSSRPHTVIQMIYMKGTEDKVDEYVRFWNRYKVNGIRVKPLQTWSGEIEQISTLSAIPQDIKQQLAKPCDRLWRHLCILWDGTVVPCEFDYDKIYPLGNINNESLSEIWNSERIINLRKMHLSGKRSDIDLCKSCTYSAPSALENLAIVAFDTLMTTKIISDLDK
jgi:radical SAM protein with 4Fe4S-binding SPASM domain